MTKPLLQIKDLSVAFDTPLGQVRAADEVSFDLHEDESLALVGETGCGKSVVASAILQLLPNNAAVEGEVVFGQTDLLRLGENDISHIRGREIAVVFQNPSLALNPVLRVGEQIGEPLEVHKNICRAQAREMAESMLKRLGLSKKGLMRMYPFQFSGGMNQRVMIATSMILSPKIIIADEPSKGLDAAMTKAVVGEMAKIKAMSGASLLLITHDLTLAEEISDRVAVMYCGEILEIGKSDEIFRDPLHPYTRALLDCLPQRGFKPVPGTSPSMIYPPQGCKFHPRCPQKEARCLQRPGMRMMEGEAGCRTNVKSEGRRVRCWLC